MTGQTKTPGNVVRIEVGRIASGTTLSLILSSCNKRLNYVNNYSFGRPRMNVTWQCYIIIYVSALKCEILNHDNVVLLDNGELTQDANCCYT